MTAFSFYNDFKKYQLERGQDRLPTLSLYRVVIIMFLNLHDLRAAETCFQELRDSKILKPNSYIYSTMMFAYLRARNRDKVLDLFSEMHQNKVIVTDLCRKLFAMAKGGKLFRKWYSHFKQDSKKMIKTTTLTLKQKRDMKNTFETIYEYLIAYNRDYVLGSRIASDIEDLGIDVSPFITYRFIIACASFDHMMVKELLNLYHIQNLKFDKHALLGYITYLFKTNQRRECLDVIEKFHGKNLPTPRTIYYSLQCVFFDRQRFEDTIKRYKSFGWDGRVYSVLIKFYARDEYKVCEEYWKEFVRRESITLLNDIQVSDLHYQLARQKCITEMLWVCVWKKKFDDLRKVWVEGVVGLGMDRNKFEKFHAYLVPNPSGSGQQKLIDVI